MKGEPIYFSKACTACRNVFVILDFMPIHCPACGLYLDDSAMLGVDWCVNDCADTRVVAVNRSKRMIYVKGPNTTTAVTNERERILLLIAKSEAMNRKHGREVEASLLRDLQDYIRYSGEEEL